VGWRGRVTLCALGVAGGLVALQLLAGPAAAADKKAGKGETIKIEGVRCVPENLCEVRGDECVPIDDEDKKKRVRCRTIRDDDEKATRKK
jgi:hypothetical protein